MTGAGPGSLFDRLRDLTLPLGSYAVFGSGPLLIRGIVPPSNDLDVLCLPDAWDLVARQATLEHLPEYGVTVASMFEGKITFGTSWGIGDFDVDELIRTAETIEGLPFVRLRHVVAYKKLRDSRKDRAHLESLARYLQRNGSEDRL